MNEEKKAEITRWYEKADHDIKNAKIVISSAPDILDTACFHCQQAVEKYLKAYLLYQGEVIKKTHSLDWLLKHCAVFDYDFEKFDFKNLEDFAVEIRYPDDALVPSFEEAKEYLQIAETVKALVLSKVILN
jgi:HEPN domain-containing protein